MRHFNLSQLVALLFAAAVFVGINNSCDAQTLDLSKFDPEDFNPAKFEEYGKQLNAILKTRRDEEKKFVEEIVLRVKNGKIPSKLVATSFKWVRNKRPQTKYPFVYFERVIRLQAAKLKLGGEIPAFDYAIYRSRANRFAGGR